MKKLGEIFIILLIVTVMASGAIVFVVLGSRSAHIHYVCLEVNPRVEFLADAKHRVKSIRPINKEAKELLIGEDFVGLKMEDACDKFLNLCAKAGYIKVDDGNAVKLTVLSGINQALEVNLSKAIDEFFVDNNILGVLIDNSQDLSQYKQAKKQGVDIEKYDLMLAVKEGDESANLDSLRKLNNRKLIKRIEKSHENYDWSYSEEELANKTKLIDFNRQKYDEHINSINAESTRTFKEKLKKYRAENTKNYKVDYNKEYNQWLEGANL